MEQEQSPIRVQISDQMMSDGIAIRMMLRYGPESLKIMRVTEGGWNRFEDVEGGIISGATIQLPHDFGRALLDALLRFYQGASDMHTVRSDLLHERSRVDKMIATMTKIMERIGNA
jgi:hypothetical protein